jgi:hypothetical protein
MAGGVAQGVGPEFKPKYRKKKKRRKESITEMYLHVKPPPKFNPV